MIDLHSHTDQSDGTDSPAELVALARGRNLEALAITDHDTLAGYDLAAPVARECGLDLVCGVEVSTRLDAPLPESAPAKRRSSIHLLAYFPVAAPPPEFRDWLLRWQKARRERNLRLIARLNALGVAIELAEVEALGRFMTGRPHFARILVRKGHAQTIQDAFDRYLADGAQASVERDEPGLFEAITAVREMGGIPSLAHPMRLPEAASPVALEQLVRRACGHGLSGIEVYYSDHTPGQTEQLAGLADKLGLAATGGSDYHGDNKPGIRLGNGRGPLRVEKRILDRLRAAAKN